MWSSRANSVLAERVGWADPGIPGLRSEIQFRLRTSDNESDRGQYSKTGASISQCVWCRDNFASLHNASDRQ
jgi:hypothetical protein